MITPCLLGIELLEQAIHGTLLGEFTPKTAQGAVIRDGIFNA